MPEAAPAPGSYDAHARNNPEGLAVVDDEHHPACVISVRDVVSFLVDAFPREILNLPTQELQAPTREGA